MKSVPLRLNPSVRGELLVELFPSYVASGQRNLALTCRQRPTRNHTARLLCRPPLLPALPAKERPGWPRDGYRFLTWSNSRCRENLLALRRGNGCSSWSRGGGCAGCRSPDGCCCGSWIRCTESIRGTDLRRGCRFLRWSNSRCRDCWWLRTW